MTLFFLVLAAIGICLAAFDVLGQVARASDAGPFDPALLVTYGWVVGVSILGGVASFYGKVRTGQTRWINLGEFVGELCTSALAGLLTYWLCRAAGLGEWWSAAFVGIAGHMGSRALFLLEKILERWFNRVLPGSTEAKQAVEPSRGAPGDER